MAFSQSFIYLWTIAIDLTDRKVTYIKTVHDAHYAQWPPEIIHSMLHLRNYAHNVVYRVFDCGLFYPFVRGYSTGMMK